MAKLVPRHFTSRACYTVCLIDDDQIPTAVDDGIDPLFVVFFNLFIGPASTFLQRFDGVHRRDNLIILSVDVIAVCKTSNRVEI